MPAGPSRAGILPGTAFQPRRGTDAVQEAGDVDQRLPPSDTGQLLYVSLRHRVLAAAHENDARGVDVIDASAIAECALHGQVVYA
jgi:hypothetical protein